MSRYSETLLAAFSEWRNNQACFDGEHYRTVISPERSVTPDNMGSPTCWDAEARRCFGSSEAFHEAASHFG